MKKYLAEYESATGTDWFSSAASTSIQAEAGFGEPKDGLNINDRINLLMVMYKAVTDSVWSPYAASAPSKVASSQVTPFIGGKLLLKSLFHYAPPVFPPKGVIPEKDTVQAFALRKLARQWRGFKPDLQKPFGEVLRFLVKPNKYYKIFNKYLFIFSNSIILFLKIFENS